MLSYLLLVLLLQQIGNGACQTKASWQSRTVAVEPTTEFLYGRAVCQLYVARRNTTRLKIVVCPKEYKYCFTSAIVVKRGGKYELDIQRKGCWSSSAADQGRCRIGGCVLGKTVTGNIQQTCCCRGFACNKNSTYVGRVLRNENIFSTAFPISSETTAKKRTARVKDISPRETVILGVISSVFATFLVLSIVFVSWRCAAQKNKTGLPKKSHHKENTVEEAVQYTVIKNDNIQFVNVVCKGKFSTVWKAEYEGKQVAIKIFAADSNKHWKNERKVYNLLGFHSNIAEVLAGVVLVSPFSTKKALIMTCYNFGSLFQYLKSHLLSWDEMYTLILSLANGVAYIHGEIDEYDHVKRTVIVHRNLNSSNVLIKEDGNCVLSGFGLAAHVTGKNVERTVEGGQVLYMPPEVLNDAVNWHDWESALKQADVYSLGLILWEIVTRCKDLYRGECLPEASLPYQAELSVRPTAKALYDYISNQRKRPVFPIEAHWSDKSISVLKNTIEECWDTEPEARLTALCVVKRMQEIHNTRTNSKRFKEAQVNTDDDFVNFCAFKPTIANTKCSISMHSLEKSNTNASLVGSHVSKCETFVNGSFSSNGNCVTDKRDCCNKWPSSEQLLSIKDINASFDV